MARMRGFLWLFAGIIVALVAGVVGYQTLSRVTEAPVELEGEVGPNVSVAVAARPVGVRTQLTAEDVELREMPVTAAPEGAVRSIEDAVGRLTTVDLYTGEPILAQRLVDPNVITGNGRLSLVMVEDEVLIAVPAQDLMSNIGVLKPGDHVDMLYSLEFPANRGPGNAGEDENELATFTLLQNLTVAALVGGESTPQNVASVLPGQETETEDAHAAPVKPDAVLLTISPQDALAFKYMKDAGGIIDLVLRAPGVDRPFEVDPVDVDYLIDRYDIPTQIGR